MVRIISICSGKGGVGKTTVATNLGLALQKLGKSTAVVDTNFTTAHLGLYFGMLNNPVTLNDFLLGRASMSNAIQIHPSGLRVVPASLNFSDLQGMDTTHLKELLENEFRGLDFVLIDSAPGFGKEALISMNSCHELIFVANPYLPSVVDVAKARHVIEALENRPYTTGVILNRVRRKSYELKTEEVAQFCSMPVLGSIPESEKILAASNKRSLALKGPCHKSFIRIAARLASIYYKESFWERLMGI